MNESPYYPAWLGPAVVAGESPWQTALHTTMPSFLASFTLHDSCWLGLYLEAGQEGLLVVRWDTSWTEGRVPYPGPTVAEWPVLLCRLRSLSYVSIGLTETGIAGAHSGPLTKPRADGDHIAHETIVEAHDGSRASLVHATDVELLCLSATGEVLPVKV